MFTFWNRFSTKHRQTDPLPFAGIDPCLWSESIKAAAYVYNNLPNEALEWSTPSDIWLDKTLVSN